MKKKYILSFVMFVTFFLGINGVLADYCTECQQKGTPCGYCGYSCALNDNGVCVINSHDQELWDAAECAKNAKSSKECSKCDNYTWNNQTSTCQAIGTDGSKTPKVTCGNIDKIPKKIPELTSFIVTVIQILVPIILVILGSIDLIKGVSAQKEDEIKKGQQILIKRIIVAVIIFFVVIIVKFLVSIVAEVTDDGGSNINNIIDCIDCFISNDCS